jgi:hypothetical protein
LSTAAGVFGGEVNVTVTDAGPEYVPTHADVSQVPPLLPPVLDPPVLLAPELDAPLLPPLPEPDPLLPLDEPPPVLPLLHAAAVASVATKHTYFAFIATSPAERGLPDCNVIGVAVRCATSDARARAPTDPSDSELRLRLG